MRLNKFPQLFIDEIQNRIIIIKEYSFLQCRYSDEKNGNLFSVLSVVGLHCCTRVFSSRGEQGLLFAAVNRLLIVVASLAAEHRL